MRIALRAVFINVSAILASLSIAVFATAASADLQKHTSSKSSSDKRSTQPEFYITNETEYADFVKKREGINQSSSAKSVMTQTSRYSTASAMPKSEASSRTKAP